MRIYSAAATWPLLQTLNEIKHPSGLFAATATYIRPTRNAATPSGIPSSIGNLSLYPTTPVVSKDTSGFETLTATGYGVWSTVVSDEVLNISRYEMPVYYYFQRGPTSQGFVPEGNTLRLPIIIQSGWVKKMGDAVPQLSTPLSIVSPSVFSVTIPEDGRVVTGTPVLNQNLSMVKQNKFGSIIETEASYEIRPFINLGIFYGPNAP